jgi:hypothetical protein
MRYCELNKESGLNIAKNTNNLGKSARRDQNMTKRICV